MFTTQGNTVAIFDLATVDEAEPAVSRLVEGSSLHAHRIALAPSEQQVAQIASSDLLFYCISGRIFVRLNDIRHEMRPHTMLFLPQGERFTLEATEASSLLRIGSGKCDSEAGLRSVEQPSTEGAEDRVIEASQESFPASDPPAFNATIASPAIT